MRQQPDDAVTGAALAARRGDDAGAEAFVRATQADVWRLCAALGDRGTADDLTQETYARAFASLHRFTGRSTARAWVLSIARRVCADAVRSRVADRRLDQRLHRRPAPSGAAGEPASRRVRRRP